MDFWTNRTVGEAIGVSQWHEITQARIDLFAEATDDWQFIHVDPVRAAAEAPFGGTIAHGFLILSMLPVLGAETLSLPERAFLVNHGLDRLRFVAPVRAGKRVRAHFAFAGLTNLSPARVAVKLKVRVEIEGEKRAALTIDPLIALIELIPAQAVA